MIRPYYEDKWVTIYHGDCREILPQLPKVDLVLTDPPYMNVKGGTRQKDYGVANHFQPTYTVGDIWGASLDWVELAIGKAKLGVMIFCSYHNVAELRNAINVKPVALVTWQKRNTPPSVQNAPHYSTEFIWLFQMASGLNWKGLKTFYDIPKLSTGCISSGERFMDKEKRAIHPTQKPETLIMELLKIGGESILDPFLGTGTTAWCAKKLNRHCIGIEIEEKYCEIAAKRCSQDVMELNI